MERLRRMLAAVAVAVVAVLAVAVLPSEAWAEDPTPSPSETPASTVEPTPDPTATVTATATVTETVQADACGTMADPCVTVMTVGDAAEHRDATVALVAGVGVVTLCCLAGLIRSWGSGRG